MFSMMPNTRSQQANSLETPPDFNVLTPEFLASLDLQTSGPSSSHTSSTLASSTISASQASFASTAISNSILFPPPDPALHDFITNPPSFINSTRSPANITEGAAASDHQHSGAPQTELQEPYTEQIALDTLACAETLSSMMDDHPQLLKQVEAAAIQDRHRQLSSASSTTWTTIHPLVPATMSRPSATPMPPPIMIPVGKSSITITSQGSRSDTSRTSTPDAAAVDSLTGKFTEPSTKSKPEKKKATKPTKRATRKSVLKEQPVFSTSGRTTTSSQPSKSSAPHTFSHTIPNELPGHTNFLRPPMLFASPPKTFTAPPSSTGHHDPLVRAGLPSDPTEHPDPQHSEAAKRTARFGSNHFFGQTPSHTSGTLATEVHGHENCRVPLDEHGRPDRHGSAYPDFVDHPNAPLAAISFRAPAVHRVNLSTLIYRHFEHRRPVDIVHLIQPYCRLLTVEIVATAHGSPRSMQWYLNYCATQNPILFLYNVLRRTFGAPDIAAVALSMPEIECPFVPFNQFDYTQLLHHHFPTILCLYIT